MKPISKLVLSVIASVLFLLITSQSVKASPNVWIGTTDTDWAKGTNWSLGHAPNSADDVVIPDASGTPNDPTVSAGAACGTLNIASGGILNGGANTLTVYAGGWSNSGTFNPGSGTVTFNRAGAQTIAGTAVTQTFNNLTTSSTSALTISGSTTTLTLNGTMTLGSGTSLTAGTATAINVAGNWTNNGGTFTPGSGTVAFNGVGPVNINGTAASQTFYNLTVNITSGSPAILVTGNSTVTLNIGGTLTLTAGIFSPSAITTAINMTGANAYWTNNGGTFTPSSGTVSFTSSSAGTKQINGTAASQTFNNLTINTGSTIVAVAGSTATLNAATLTITLGTLSMGAGATNTLTVTGTLRIDGTGITTAAANLTITANTITQNAGTISTTGASGNITINSTGSVGAFALGNVTSVGYIYVGATTAPSSITQGSGTVLTLSNDATGDIIDLHAAGAIGTVTIPMKVSLAGATYNYVGATSSSPGAIYIDSAGALRLATVTTNSGSINIGTVTIPTSIIAAAVISATSGGATIVTSGTLTFSGSSRVRTLTSGNITLTSEGASALKIVQSAGAITLNKYATNPVTYSVTGSTIIVPGALTINTGVTLALGGGVSTKIINTGGSFVNYGTLQLQGDEIITNLIVDPVEGTVTYVGSGAYASGLVTGDLYYNLIFASTGSGSWTLANALTVNHDLTVTTGTLDVGASKTIAVTGTLTINGGTITGASNNVTITANTISHSSGNITTTTSGNITLTSEGSSTLGTVTSAGALTLAKTTASATYTVGAYTISVAGILTINSSVNLISNSFSAINVAGNWVNNGTFTPGTSSTVTFNGSSAQTISPTTFWNLIIANTHASDEVTITSGTVTADNTLYVNDGIFTIDTGKTLDVNYGGTAVTIASGATLKVNGGTVTVDGAALSRITVSIGGTLNIVSGSVTALGCLTLNGKLQMAAGTLTLGNGSTVLNALSIGASGGADTGDITGGTIYLNGNTTARMVFTVTDGGKFLPTITAGDTGNLVVFRALNSNYIDNGSTAPNFSNVKFNRLQIGDSGYTASIALRSTNTAPLNVYNKLTIYTGTTFDHSLNPDPIYVDKFVCDGTYTKTATADMFFMIDGDSTASNGSISGATDPLFGNLDIGSGSAVTVTLGRAITADSLDIATNGVLDTGTNYALNVNGNVTNAGTLTLNNSSVGVTGNWDNNGTFNCGQSTVTLNGTNQTLAGSTTFYNLTKDVSSADTLIFDNTATQTVTHTLTLNGAPGQLLSLRSDSPTNQYNLTLQVGGTQSLSYLDVKDSYASDGQTLAAGSFSTNSLNNNNWTFKIISVVLRDAGDTGDYTTWALGSGKVINTVYLMDTGNCVLVKNDGNVSEDFSIQGVGVNWTLGSVNGENQCVLMGLFNGNSAPVEGAFSTTYDIINGTTRWATVSGGNGNYEGANDGDNVAAGSGEKLYIYLKTPSSVTSGLQETITVTIGSREH